MITSHAWFLVYLWKPTCHLGFNDQFLPSSDRFASSNLLCMRQIFLLETHARLRVPLRWKVSYSNNGFLSTQVISYVKIFSKWMLFASNDVCPGCLGIGFWFFGESNVNWGCDKIWKTCRHPLSEFIEVRNTSQLHSCLQLPLAHIISSLILSYFGKEQLTCA